MAKYTGPVLKKCRALGISPMELGIDKKSNRQVKVSRKKQSNYALQLKEKQKVKFIYGILEKQFKMYYNKRVTSLPLNPTNRIKSCMRTSKKATKSYFPHGCPLIMQPSPEKSSVFPNARISTRLFPNISSLSCTRNNPILTIRLSFIGGIVL